MTTQLWILSGIIFILLTIILAKVSLPWFKKENSEKMWKLWGMRSMYWQGLSIVSFFTTVLFMFVLKWTHIISF